MPKVLVLEGSRTSCDVIISCIFKYHLWPKKIASRDGYALLKFVLLPCCYLLLTKQSSMTLICVMQERTEGSGQKCLQPSPLMQSFSTCDSRSYGLCGHSNRSCLRLHAKLLLTIPTPCKCDPRKPSHSCCPISQRLSNRQDHALQSSVS